MTYPEYVESHIAGVREKCLKLAEDLYRRGMEHDNSKRDPEEFLPMLEHFDKLRKTKYGSEEYSTIRALIQPAVDLHYSRNTHHPEHYQNGLNGMCLLDLVEMLCDWAEASKGTVNGSIAQSMEVNKQRFGISEQLFQIMQNTVKKYQLDV
jgi:hypothetical protein